MKKISVIGHYANGLKFFDGQTIKTKIFTNELCREYGNNNVLKFDTHGGAKTILKAPIYVWKAMKSSNNVIIFPAHNGLRIFGRLLPLFKLFFKNRKIHYVVIGGWLPKMLETKKGLAKLLKKFDGIFVESNTMKKALELQGFDNIHVMPNCKELTKLSSNDLIEQNDEPFKLCTFSRVMKEKGIEEAVEAVKTINTQYGKTVYTLTIYGQIDPEQVEWFDKLKNDFPKYVTYGGLVPFYKSVEVLKNYFALLFPTYYEGEGFAGTLIDALFAGLPVVATDWKYNSEIITSSTGFLYPVHDNVRLGQILEEIKSNPSIVNQKRINCINESHRFSIDEVIRILVNKLEM